MNITHYILGVANGDEWYYLKRLGIEWKGRRLVNETTTDPAEAQRYFILDAAIRRSENLWGGNWEVVAEPAHAIIDKKLYEKQKN